MSDPVHTSSGGLLSINRPSIVKGYEMWKSAKETTLGRIQRLYSGLKESTIGLSPAPFNTHDEFLAVCQDDALEEIRRIADEQDSRLDALQSRLLEEGRTTFGSRYTPQLRFSTIPHFQQRSLKLDCNLGLN